MAAEIHKLQKNGVTIYPATTTNAVVDASTKKSLSENLIDLNIKAGLVNFVKEAPANNATFLFRNENSPIKLYNDKIYIRSNDNMAVGKQIVVAFRTSDGEKYSTIQSLSKDWILVEDPKSDLITKIYFANGVIGAGITVDIDIALNTGIPAVLFNNLIVQELGNSKEQVISQDFSTKTFGTKKEISDISGFDYQTVDGEYVFNNGNISSSSGTPYFRTDYVNIEGLKKIRTYIGTNVNLVGLAFYDTSKKFISGVNFNDFEYQSLVTIEVPENATYVVVSCFKSNREYFVLYGVGIASNIFSGLAAINNKINSMQKYEFGNLLDGYINSIVGNAQSATSYKMTDFISVNAKKLRVGISFSVQNVGFAFYDRNKKYISGFDGTSYSIGDIVDVDVPEDAFYFRTCAINKSVDKMVVYVSNYVNKLDSVNPCFYTETSLCRTYKNILCIGDSLTEGALDYKENGAVKEFKSPEYSYPGQLSALTGRKTTNKGDSGKTTKSWWEAHQEDDLSGSDCCIIALGRNDYESGRETTSEERHEYMGYIISKVRSDNPQIPIFVATLLNYYKGEGADGVNTDMRSIASENDCFLLDISKYGKLVSKVDNKSHCTAVGYSKLAEYYFRYISYIMEMEPEKFTNIQYVGTDKKWE